MGPFDMKPMITAANAGAEATDRLAAAIEAALPLLARIAEAAEVSR